MGKGTYTSFGGTNLTDYFFPSAPSAVAAALGHRFGGYQAPTYSGQYFGLGLAAILVAGVIVWRRDRRLWLFGALAVVSVPLSFGLQFHHWTLWRLFVRFPLMDNVIPSRFLLISYLAVAVMLGLIVDHAAADVNRWRFGATPPPDHASPDARAVASGRSTTLGVLAGLVVSGIALVPIAVYYAPALPFTTRPVVLPLWYRTAGPHVTGSQVVLAFPLPFAYLQSSMTWQAVDGLHYSMVGGGGPDSISQRAGKERAAQSYVGALSFSSSATTITPGDISVVRRALEGWGVTMVVVPDTSDLPIYEQLHDVKSIATVITAVNGPSTVPSGRCVGVVGSEPRRSAGPGLHRAAHRLCRRQRSKYGGRGQSRDGVHSGLAVGPWMNEGFRNAPCAPASCTVSTMGWRDERRSTSDNGRPDAPVSPSAVRTAGASPDEMPAPGHEIGGLRRFSALDGIRALAVMAVLCYHAGISWMGGGLLGVDVFFVLSGFLITSLLCREMARTATMQPGEVLGSSAPGDFSRPDCPDPGGGGLRLRAPQLDRRDSGAR